METAVEAHYEGLFTFALSLAGNRDDACELTQETFCRFAGKGQQIRDRAKTTWLTGKVEIHCLGSFRPDRYLSRRGR